MAWHWAAGTLTLPGRHGWGKMSRVPGFFSSSCKWPGPLSKQKRTGIIMRAFMVKIRIIKDLLAVAVMVDNCTVWCVLHDVCILTAWAGWGPLFWELDSDCFLKQNEAASHFTVDLMLLYIYRAQVLLIVGSFSEVFYWLDWERAIISSKLKNKRYRIFLPACLSAAVGCQ